MDRILRGSTFFGGGGRREGVLLLCEEGGFKCAWSVGWLVNEGWKRR